MDAYCGLNSATWSRVENGQVVEPEGIIEPSDVEVVGTSQRVKDQIHELTEWRLLRHWWSGVFPGSAISPPILTSCSSHTEACSTLGAADGITALNNDSMCTVTTLKGLVLISPFSSFVVGNQLSSGTVHTARILCNHGSWDRSASSGRELKA